MAKPLSRWKAPPSISPRNCGMPSKRCRTGGLFWSGAGYCGVSRLYGEDHLSTSLPCQRRGQHAKVGIAASACRLLLRYTTGAREITIQRQMARALWSRPAMDVDLLRHKRLAAFGAHHHPMAILVPKIVPGEQLW